MNPGGQEDIALVFTLPIFRNFDYWGVQDWDQHFFYQVVARRSILQYRQFPLWNPYTLIRAQMREKRGEKCTIWKKIIDR